MKYKVGDKVRVKSWEQLVNEFGFLFKELEFLNTKNADFGGVMRDYCGQVVTISKVSDNKTYLIKEDRYEWDFDEDVFLPIEETYIEQVAKMLGVEIGEEFVIDNCLYNPYKFTNTDLVDKHNNSKTNIIGSLVTGISKIKKPCWKPKLYTKYYHPDISIPKLYNYLIWTNHERDYYLYKKGFVCKTPEEAVKLAKEMLNK